MRPKIVIIDDHKFTLDVITDVLSEENKYDIHSFSSLPQIDVLREIQPNVILLDVMLQHHDGRIICKILRGDKAFSKTGIILLSAFIDNKKDINECGANTFINKPFDIDVLLYSVAKQVELQKIKE